MVILTNMKKILTIFLVTVFLSLTPVYQEVYAQETEIEEDAKTTDTESITESEDTTLAENLEEETESSSGVTVWTILFAVACASLFVAVAYYILKNFNIGTGK